MLLDKSSICKFVASEPDKKRFPLCSLPTYIQWIHTHIIQILTKFE